MNSSVIDVRIINPETGDDVIDSLHIQEGRILARGPAPADFKADRTINGKGLIACPGLVDCYARLREPGFEKKADIRSESRAALYNGITTIVCSPDTDPVVDEVATVELINRRSTDAGFARVRTLAAMTQGLDGEHLTELATLASAGCVGATNADVPVNNTLVLRRVMEYASTFNIVLVFAPVDFWLAGSGCAHEGTWSTRLGLPGIPVAAETVALGMLLELSDQTGAKLHFSRITSARGTSMIRKAKADGMQVTADTSINHLFFTESCLENFNSQFRSVAPFRSEADRAALVAAVIDGTFDAVCSDHAPHEPDAKLAPFPSAEPGLSSFDSYFQLLLRFSQEQNVPLVNLLKVACNGPADIFSLDAGTLNIGATADVVLFDTETRKDLNHNALWSRGQNTPHLGDTLNGIVRHVAVGGHWHDVPTSG